MTRNRKGCAALTTRYGCLLLLAVVALCGAVRAADDPTHSFLPRKQYSERHLAYLNFTMASNDTKNEIDELISALETEYFHNMLHTDPRYKERPTGNAFSPEEAKLLECLGGTNDPNNKVNHAVLKWAHGVRSRRWETWLEAHPNPFAKDFVKENGMEMTEWRRFALPSVLVGNGTACSPGDQWEPFSEKLLKLRARRRWALFGFQAQWMADAIALAAATLPSLQRPQEAACLADWKSDACWDRTRELRGRLKVLHGFSLLHEEHIESDALSKLVDDFSEGAGARTRDVQVEITPALEKVLEAGAAECDVRAERLKMATDWPLAGKGPPPKRSLMRARVETEIAAQTLDDVVIGLQAVTDMWSETYTHLKDGKESLDYTAVGATVHQTIESAKQQMKAASPLQKVFLVSGLPAYRPDYYDY